MKRMGKMILSAALSALTLFSFSGCSGRPIDAPEGGGVTDKTDHSAPKKIESKELSDFSAHFYLHGEWSPGRENQFYTFAVRKDENGVLTASAKTEDAKGAGVSRPADETLLAALQVIIDARNLAARNGVYHVTAGLPPEFQPCRVSASYASGERLTFTENNNPDAEWAKETYLAFAHWFADKGDDSLLPPKYTGQVARLLLKFADGNLRYDYGDWNLREAGSEETRHVWIRTVYDAEAKKRIADENIPFPEGIYDEISAILDRYDIRPFDKCSVLYGTGRRLPDKKEKEEEKKSHLLSIHIKYADGHIVNIDTSDADDIEMLRPLVDELVACQDAYFEE